MSRSSIVVELYVEFPRAWILTRGPEDHGGSVGVTVQGRLVICEADGYALGDEEPLNVLAIAAVGEAKADTDSTGMGILAVVIPGDIYAWIKEMDAARKGADVTEVAEVPRPTQAEMWPGC